MPGNEKYWLKVEIEVPRALADEYSDLLQKAGALAVTMEAADDEKIYESYSRHAPQWQQQRLTGLFAATVELQQILNLLANEGSQALRFPPRVSRLAEQNWNEAWKSQIQPVHVAHQFWICPSWHTAPPQADTVLTLDPGLAFGTGSHATTRLCLQWISERSWNHKRVLDYGCGSGILAIATLLFGAAYALGVDIDAQAIQSSLGNAGNNGVAERFDCVLVENQESGQCFDVVFANILCDALLQLAPQLDAAVKKSGVLLLSGILEEQSAAIKSAYQGFEFEQRTDDGWVLLIGRRCQTNVAGVPG